MKNFSKQTMPEFIKKFYINYGSERTPTSQEKADGPDGK
jgi:hypothetical protein